MRTFVIRAAFGALLAAPVCVSAQTVTEQHPHPAAAPASSPWHVMQDGVVFLTLNHQGGPRGGTELGSQNWWMGMAQPTHGNNPVSFHVFVRVRPPAPMGRMTDMVMIEGMH